MAASPLSYAVHVHDHEGTRVLVVERFQFLTVMQRVNWADNHKLQLKIDEDDPLVAQLEAIEKDYIFRIFRTDRRISPDPYLIYEGFHRTPQWQQSSKGDLIYTSFGRGYDDLLERRIIVPPSNKEYSKKSGAAETVMKAYVDEQAVDPTDADRRTPYLSVEADAGRGDTIKFKARYHKLMDTMIVCAADGGLRFKTVGTGAVPGFEFQVRDEIWGLDRTEGNGVNPPTIFASEFGNLFIPIHARSASKEMNVCYAGGQGQGMNRRIRELSSGAEDDTPWNRREGFTNASMCETNDCIDTQAQEWLDTNAEGNRFSAKLQQTPACLYPRDFALGDRVTCKFMGDSFDIEIMLLGICVSAEQTGVTETVAFDLDDVEITS